LLRAGTVAAAVAQSVDGSAVQHQELEGLQHSQQQMLDVLPEQGSSSELHNKLLSNACRALPAAQAERGQTQSQLERPLADAVAAAADQEQD
jgi:hypothetical protein